MVSGILIPLASWYLLISCSMLLQIQVQNTIKDTQNLWKLEEEEENNPTFEEEEEEREIHNRENLGGVRLVWPGGFTAVLKQFSSAGEDDEAYLSITQHREFMSLLEEPNTAFWEGNLPVRPVLDLGDDYLSPSHYLYWFESSKNFKSLTQIVINIEEDDEKVETGLLKTLKSEREEAREKKNGESYCYYLFN